MAPGLKWIKAKSDEPVTKVAERALRLRLEVVEHYLPLAAQKHEESIDYVHQLRVGARRSETAIRTFQRLVPEWRVGWMIKQLKKIRKATNDARDDDVFIRRFAKDDSPAAAHLLERIVAHRAEAQRSVVKAYNKLAGDGRFSKRVDQLCKRVRLRGSLRKKKGKEPTIGQWAAGQLGSVLEEFLEAGEASLEDTDLLHQFRIIGKRLRYSVELLSGAFPSQLVADAYPELVALQGKLGEINDHASAIERLERWIDETSDKLSQQFLKRTMRFEIDRMEEARQAFLQWWTPKRQRRMREVFEQALTANGARRTA